MAEKAEQGGFLQSVANASHKSDPAIDLKFYNYEPKDKSFAKFDPLYFKQVRDIETHYQTKIKKLMKEYSSFDRDTLSLVPKKANSDLKNSLAGKLDIMNKRTERSVLELMSN